MNRFSVCAVTIVGLYVIGCGTYEYRKRPDASEVAVIRDIQRVFPEFANEITSVLDGLKVQNGPIEGSVGRAEFKGTIARLYEQKDQLNAQLRDFVVARYQSYINAELDPDKSARERGRRNWNDVTAKVQVVALELRKIKESIDKAEREHAEAVERLKELNIQVAESRSSIDKKGSEIESQFSRVAAAAHLANGEAVIDQVQTANMTLADALRTDKSSQARTAAYTIERSVSEFPISPALMVLKSRELKGVVDIHIGLTQRLKEQHSAVALAEESLVAEVKKASVLIENINIRLPSPAE